MSVFRAATGLAALVFTLTAHASIVSISSGDTVLANRGTNLVANGSFEADDGTAPNLAYWATGTTLTPFVNLQGWTGAGGPQSYASWGHDVSPTNILRGSDVIPDGRDAVYFGAGIMIPLNVLPTYHPDGEVTFSSTPTIQSKPGFGPVTLSQTLSGLNTSQQYLLDFWASSEDATSTWADGFFAFDITGESRTYLACPTVNDPFGLGASQRYYIVFKPTASSVTLTWTNWGHYIDNVGGMHSELVLDDVIVNPVPEPAAFAAVVPVALMLFRRRRAS